MTAPRVTLLTDFGTADGYAAAMAGVIAARVPSVFVDHASHDIEPGDILSAALTLHRYAFLYPAATVHLVVVDPGVGSSRRAIAARVRGRLFVAPDNGVLTRVLEPADANTIVALDASAAEGDTPSAERIDPPSRTFHGRDVFAPAAARLAGGERLESLGPVVQDPVLLSIPEHRQTDAGVAGEIIQVDRFGNLITNILAEAVAPADETRDVRVEGRSVGPVRGTYSDVGKGEVVALIGSLGTLEVSVRDGNAAARLGVGRGARVLAVR